MAILQQSIKSFDKGVHNVLPDEVIPKNAASDSLNWLTNNGHIELIYGKKIIGSAGGVGKSYGEWTAYKVDGTPVRFRKVEGAIQWLNGTTWTNVITGLSNSDYTCSTYSSLAGSAIYFFGEDGIYKVMPSHPSDYASMYDSTKNFKGWGFVDKGRTILWGRKDDPTGLYGSKIDPQNSTIYTSVSSEPTTSLTGTLAFKAGGAKRACFGVQITVGSEVFTDNFNGILTGSVGGTGTINYMTGAYTVSVAGAGTANYQWIDDTDKGILDFGKSATRIAGEGFIFRQDIGGDAIKVVIPYEGEYFSLKERSCYRLAIQSNDTDADNNVFRTDIGVEGLRSAVGTSTGIVFINSSNPSVPFLSIIKRNITGDNFDAPRLCDHFKFENYTYDDALLETWDRFVVIACKQDSLENNRLLMVDVIKQTVDVVNYGIRTSTKMNGRLYGGSTISQTTYELFSGFDDDGYPIINYWIGNGDTYGSDILKKVKKLRYMGVMDPNQAVEVYMQLDNGDWSLVGTIRGDGSYVDYSSSFAIGTYLIGESIVGGEATAEVYGFTVELKVRVTKFRKRNIKFVATKIGYVSITRATDFDIWKYEDRLPKKYRSKQNVSLDGTETDMDNPDY